VKADREQKEHGRSKELEDGDLENTKNTLQSEDDLKEESEDEFNNFALDLSGDLAGAIQDPSYFADDGCDELDDETEFTLDSANDLPFGTEIDLAGDGFVDGGCVSLNALHAGVQLIDDGVVIGAARQRKRESELREEFSSEGSEAALRGRGGERSREEGGESEDGACETHFGGIDTTIIWDN